VIEKEGKGFLVKYPSEYKAISEVLDLYRESQRYPSEIATKLVDQISFKGVLEGVECKRDEVERLLQASEELREKALKFKQFRLLLLGIDSGSISLFELKKKDEIDLENSTVEFELTHGFSENNKYMFSITYSKANMIGIKKPKKLTLGTDSESARKDWVFAIQILKQFPSRARQSLQYVTELKQ